MTTNTETPIIPEGYIEQLALLHPNKDAYGVDFRAPARNERYYDLEFNLSPAIQKALAEVEQKIKRRNFKTAKPEWHRYQPGKNINLDALDHDSRDYKLAMNNHKQRQYRLAMYLTIEALPPAEGESTAERRERILLNEWRMCLVNQLPFIRELGEDDQRPYNTNLDFEDPVEVAEAEVTERTEQLEHIDSRLSEINNERTLVVDGLKKAKSSVIALEGKN